MSEANKVGAISTNGTPSDFQLAPGADPSGIASSGGALWFTQHRLDSIGRLQPAGRVFSEFGPTGGGPSGIALGPDGALWFTETDANKIGRMTTSGRITEFQIPTPASAPGGIVAGPDGAMWFVEFDGNQIGRIEAGSTTAFTPPPQPPPLPLKPKQPTAAKKKSCRVPRLRGLTVRQARRKLRRAKCRYRIRGRGRIVSSRPRAGTRTRSTVRLKAKRSRR
jgi:streptogramin lyase